MSGHLWRVTEINTSTYSVVTKQNNEEHARELFRKVLGSSKDIYEVKYISS